VSQSIFIVGGGLIGCACARALAGRGADVTVFDRAPGRGAGWAAGGMIAPEFETKTASEISPALQDLAYASRALWDVFATDLGLALGGASFAIEPDAMGNSSPSPSQKRLLPNDTFIDPRILSDGLIHACRDAGVRFVQSSVQSINGADVELLLNDGTRLSADVVVLSAGANARHFAADIPELSAVVPIKGILTSVYAPGVLADVVRSGSLYLIPRGDYIIIGATSEPGVDDVIVSSKAVQDLLMGAARLLPALFGKLPVASWAGVRPGSPDHAPLIGWSSHKGVYIAAGWHRNGILLAPIAADIIANEIIGGIEDPRAAAFRPNRFALSEL
jgi:glycine oxidase